MYMNMCICECVCVYVCAYAGFPNALFPTGPLLMWLLEPELSELLPSIFLSIRVFSNESVLCNRWPKYWCFSISPSNEYSGLISFRIDWFDLLAV